MPYDVLFEVCTDSVEGALAAEEYRKSPPRGRTMTITSIEQSSTAVATVPMLGVVPPSSRLAQSSTR